VSRAGRVVGAEHIEAARRAGRARLEIMPGDIVTALARETAARLAVRLVDGPLERPAPPAVDGAAAMARGLYRRAPRWMAPRPTAPRSARRLAKLGLIGAGGVGANVAHLAANADLAAEIALVDIMPGLARATALDLNHASGVSRVTARAFGGEDMALIAGSDVVVVSAGRSRTPGMSRADLIGANARVIRQAAEAIKVYASKAIVIVVTNPLDEMTVEMLRASGLPRDRVLGMAGTLDSGRFRHALARAAGVDPADVEAMTLGSHGDEMTPVVSRARIKGRSLDLFLSRERIDACVRDAVTGGGQIVALRKTGSATLAPAHSTVELIDHIRGARTGATPVSVMLEGEYGISGVVTGVPCRLGTSGVLEIVELPLAPEELTALRAAAAAVAKRLGLA
jgi:malate dehydrogenase